MVCLQHSVNGSLLWGLYGSLSCLSYIVFLLEICLQIVFDEIMIKQKAL